MWIVELVKKPKIDDFRSDYFPRKVAYKVDAEHLVVEVRNKGGDAKMTKQAAKRSKK